MVDTNVKSLECYLHSTFAQIQDEYGQKLDILPALSTMVQVLSGSPQIEDLAEKVQVTLFIFFYQLTNKNRNMHLLERQHVNLQFVVLLLNITLVMTIVF
jgi:hypothetical protein